MKEVIKLKFSCIESETEWPFKFIFCKVWRISPHSIKATLLIQINFTPWFFLERIKTFKFLCHAPMSWSLILSGECTSWNCPGNEVKIKSSVILFPSWKIHQLFQPMIVHNVHKYLPSDWLSMVLFLFRRSGQTMSLKLKSPSMWTEGTFLCWDLMCSSWFLRS